MFTSKRLTVLALALMVAAAASAQQQVNESRKASATGVVTVETISGTIKVAGWSADEVRVTGTLGYGIERLDVESLGDRTKIKVIYPHDCRRCEGADLEISIPAGSRLEVETVSADVWVDQVSGVLDVETVSGDVKLRGQPSEIEAETVSGDLEIDAGSAPVEASSVSGSVTLLDAGDRVKATTVSGEVLVKAAVISRGDFEAVSGTVRIESDIAPNGRVTAEAVSGTIELVLPAAISAEFSVNTFSGEIDNEFGPEARRSGRYTPEKELQFSTGSGSAQVDVECFSGRVKIRKR